MRIDVLNRPTQALLATSLLLALIVAMQLLFPARPSVDGSVAMPDDEASLPEFGSAALNPPMLADLSDMQDRPLFYIGRRMPVPPKVETPPPPPTPLRLKLQGVALAGGTRVAVLRNLSSNLLLQLSEGDTHDGWTLDTVNSNSAIFSRDEQTTELLLDPDDNGGRR